jgi:hypothetical protein
MPKDRKQNDCLLNKNMKGSPHMLSEVDIKDFDKQPVTPLYSVKPKSYVQCPRTGVVYYFDHIDGMYSYCLDMFGDTIHLMAWMDVIPLAKKPE